MPIIVPQNGDHRQALFPPQWGATTFGRSRILPDMGKAARAKNNLKALREKAGLTQEQAADKFGLSKGGYVKVEDGDRGLKADRILKAAEVFGVRPEEIYASADALVSRADPPDDVRQAMEETAARAGQLMPVLGEVAAGRWIEVEQDADESRYESAPVTPDPRWRTEWQYGLVVRGTSVNLFAIDGDTLHCLDIAQSGRMPSNGELVIVEQSRDGGFLRERTAKIYHRGEHEMVELRAFSDDPRWDAPIHVPHNVFSFVLEKGLTVEIKAVVLGAYKLMPKVLRW